jgi:hypothetical protein
VKETKNKVIPINKALLKAQRSPNSMIEAISQINSEVYSFLQIEEFLKNLNEKIFEGKGEIKPLKHWYDLILELEQDSRSRFIKLFSTKSQLSCVSSRAELLIGADTLRNIKKEYSPFVSFNNLSIGVGQILDFEDQQYCFYVSGCLHFQRPREQDGNWWKKTARPVEIKNGRLLEFPLKSIPPAEEVSRILLEDINEILEEMWEQNLIPSPKTTTQEE